MIVLAVLVALFVLFFLVKKHAGPAHLAVIAGLSVYSMCGEQITDWLSSIIPSAANDIIGAAVYIALVAAFPILLYIRSPRGGLGGIFHLVEAAIFAIVLTSLLAPVLAEFFTFDTLAEQIAGAIRNYEGPIVVVGVISAYVDILIYRSHPYL